MFGGVHSGLKFAEAKSNRAEIYAEPVEVSILSPSKYTKKNLRNLLHLRKSARREATTNRAEVKSNRAETVRLCAIRFFLLAMKNHVLATRFSALAIIFS